MKKRLIKWGLVALPAFFLLALIADFALFLTRPMAPPAPRMIEVASGSSFSAVARQLEQAEVVRRAFYLTLLARFKNVQGAVHAGNYLFQEEARPAEVLRRLVAGDVVRYAFTVPEGLTLAEIAARLEREGLGSAAQFLALARDPNVAETLKIPGADLEGYLFPETYLLEKGASVKRLVQAMVNEFQRRALPEWRAAAAQRGLDLHQWVTLASIIQKEAGEVEEMPLISAVFHNRLKRGIPLQADPTVIYGIKDFDGNITRKHLRMPTPYNTYVHPGLPPGPIANPGAKALRAAAFPAAVDYLYFVARGDGSHQFSRTLQEHNRAVREFQLKGR